MNGLIKGAALGLLGVAVGFSAGCGQSFESGGGGSASSSTSTSGGTAGGGAGGGSASSSSGTGGGTGGASCAPLAGACFACAFEQCNAAYCACFVSKTCSQLALCVSLCPPGYNPCVQDCYTENPSGISDAALFQHCAAAHCGSDCTAFNPLPDCDLCLFDQCPQQTNVCLADPDCAQLLMCAKACNYDGCLTDCYAQFPNGATLADPLQQCMSNSCANECANVLGSG